MMNMAPMVGFGLNISNFGISTTAGVVYLADSAQVPRVQVQVQRGEAELDLDLNEGCLS